MTDLAELRAEVAALATRLRAVEDELAITRLIASYGPSVDSGSAEKTAAIWAEDGVFSVVGGEMTFDMNGRSDIAAMVESEGHQELILGGCAHVLTAPHVTLNGDSATCRNYALNIRWDAEADSFRVARVSANRWECSRTANGWKVAHRTNSVLDGAEAARALLGPQT